jgi:hypothetical protein
MSTAVWRGFLALAAVLALAVAPVAHAQEAFDRSRDRGPGQPTDMFGTYIRDGELLVYPFFEYYRDNDFEYKPEEMGFGVPIDFRGRYRASEGLLYLGYGLSERFAVEVEAAVITASLEKSPDDFSALPPRLEESGLGDVAARARWRWARETESRPEIFGWFETGFPFQRSKALIGTRDWEFALGSGMVRGLPWGTVTFRVSFGYADGSFEPGEYALEYLKRVSKRLRVYGGIEGTDDEVELITEFQVFLSDNVYLKLNNAFGLTSKAPDWAPEVGIMIGFPRR